MTATYRQATSVKRIADELIAGHHQELVDVHIEYVFRSEPAKENGKEKWGTARKITGLNAYLAGDTAEGGEADDFFVVEIAEPIWAVLDEPQKVALVDHELSHCTTAIDEKTGDLKLKMRPHDLEEFSAIVRRYGLWREDVEAFLKAAADGGQLSFLDDEAKKVTIAYASGDGLVTESVDTTIGGMRRAAESLSSDTP